jgi:hypothetical protein
MPKNKKVQSKLNSVFATQYSCWRYTNKRGLTVLFQIQKTIPRIEARAVIFPAVTKDSSEKDITVGPGGDFSHFYIVSPHEITEGTEISYQQFLAAWTLVIHG